MTALEVRPPSRTYSQILIPDVIKFCQKHKYRPVTTSSSSPSNITSPAQKSAEVGDAYLGLRISVFACAASNNTFSA